MASYNPVVITDEGQRIIFKALAGTYKIAFTRIALGAGEHSDSEDLTKLTELLDERQTTAVTSMVIPTSDSVVVKAQISNTDLAEGYRIREIGIFCKDAHNNNSDEVLYAVVTAAIPDYMSAISTDAAPTEFSYQFGLGVGDASKVIIVGGGNGFYTQDEVDALLANYYTRAEIDAILSGKGR